MKKYLMVFVIFVFAGCLVHGQSETVEQIISKIEPDSLMNFISELSGEKQVFINNEPYYIKTRYKGTEGNSKAADYLKEKLESYGLEAKYNLYSQTGTNVYAVKIGTSEPDKKYFISAHYDDMSNSPFLLAPGADDNASGCSVVLEAARILSGYSTKYTVVFAFWDEEEQGYVGAENFILTASDVIEGVQGVIESDMVGWDGNNDKKLLIQPSLHTGALNLKDKILETIVSYNLNVLPVVEDIGWADPMINFFPIVGLNEDSAQSSPTYHTIYDDITTINKNFLLNNAKVAIASLANLVEPTLINSVSTGTTNSNDIIQINLYPNPTTNLFNLELINNSSIIKGLRASVKIKNIIGIDEIDIPEFIINESYLMDISLKHIPSGIYFVNIRIGDELYVKKIIKF